MLRRFLPLFFLSLSHILIAQEVESPLPYSSLSIQRAESVRAYGIDLNKSSTSLELPFIDDFSQDHFPGNAAGNVIFWTGNSAKRSLGFGLEPPSVGVAVFDGLDKTGYPYDFSFSTSFGPADTLESLDIDLQDRQEVILSFFYQAEGLGELPDPADSLVLDFFRPTDSVWVKQWFMNGTVVSPFQQVQVPVNSADYLMDGFKFRFRNYATLSGSLDHWMVDWIYLGENRSLEDDVIIDVGFQAPVKTVLNNGYTSVPWKVYQQNAGVLTLPAINTVIRNLNTLGAFVDQVSYEVSYDANSLGLFPDPAEPSISASSDLILTHELNSAPNSYTFPVNVNDTCADFGVEFNFNTSPDLFEENNHFTLTQRFRDYYAYDDGEPERGYGVVNSPGADVAYRIDLLSADSIIAVDFFFLPVSINVDNELFYLTIWDEFSDSPSEIVYQDLVPRNPEYAPGDGWVRYMLQDTILALDAGSYFFGWTQVGTERLNVGNDKNIENNTDRLYYDTGAGWIQSTITGSLLIRPVVTSLKDPLLTGVPDLDRPPLKLWPNPTSDELYLSMDHHDPIQVIIVDVSGRVVHEGLLDRYRRIDTRHLADGLYQLILITEGSLLNQHAFVIQR